MGVISFATRARHYRRSRGTGWVVVLLLGAFSPLPALAKVDEGLAAVKQAALAQAGLRPQTTTQLLVRQHLAALLPQLRLTLGRGWQLSATGRTLDGLTAPEVDNDHTSYAVSASWDLARLLVPHEALQLHREEPQRAQLRLTLLARVTQLLAARCRILQREPAGPEQQEQVAELEAGLDLLTGGQALPAVTPGTPCPAAPRFDLQSRSSAAAARRPGAARRSLAKGTDDSESRATDDSDDDEAGADSEPARGAADAPAYGRR